MNRLILAVSLGLVLSIVSIGNSGDRGSSGWTGLGFAFTEAVARGRGGHRGGGGARSRGPSRSAHASVRRPTSQPQSRPTRPNRTGPSTRPSSPPRAEVGNRGDRNVNVNRNVDIDVNRRRGYGGAVVAGALVAGAFIATLPPDCTSISIDATLYYNCGGSYYIETFDGTEVVYQSVPAP